MSHFQKQKKQSFQYFGFFSLQMVKEPFDVQV